MQRGVEQEMKCDLDWKRQRGMDGKPQRDLYQNAKCGMYEGGIAAWRK